MSDSASACADLSSASVDADLSDSAKGDGSGARMPVVPGAGDRREAALLRLCRIMTAATVKAGNHRKPSLSAAQVRTLTILAASDEGVSLTTVAQCLGATPSATSRVCSRMVRDGLVDRASGPGNEIRLSLSEQGTAVLEEINRFRIDTVMPILRKLEDGEREQAWDVIERLAEAVGNVEESW